MHHLTFFMCYIIRCRWWSTTQDTAIRSQGSYSYQCQLDTIKMIANKHVTARQPIENVIGRLPFTSLVYTTLSMTNDSVHRVELFCTQS